MDAALTEACNWLVDHPWIATALICAGIVLAFRFDGVVR